MSLVPRPFSPGDGRSVISRTPSLTCSVSRLYPRPVLVSGAGRVMLSCPETEEICVLDRRCIASTTAPFCADCDRSRLTADGMWYLCLYALEGTDLRGPLRRGASSEELAALITGRWSVRADAGAEERLALRDRTPLVQIGRLKQDPEGRGIAGIFGENIYLLFDLFRYPGALVPVALRKSLDLCLPGMTEWLSRQSGRLPYQIQVALYRLSHRTTLMTLDHAGCEEEVGPPDPSDGPAEAIREQMAVVERSLKELSSQMALQTRLLGTCRERVRTLKDAGQSENLLVREIEALLQIPEVREVEVLGDRLRVFTDTVDTIVAGKRYRLGCFRLDIRFNGDVAITNLTQPYGYYDHPHVWNAKPCLGNIRPNVSKLVSEFQWVATAELLLEYLKTVNPSGWYTPIDNWEELPA